MFLKLSSDDQTLQVRVNNIDSEEMRDDKGAVVGVRFIANRELPLWIDPSLQKRPTNLAEAKKAVETAEAVLRDFQAKADDEAAKAAAAAQPAAQDEPLLGPAGFAGEPR